MTKASLKSEVEKVPERYLDLLHRLICALQTTEAEQTAAASWPHFVEAMYGSLADAPLERPSQGTYETRIDFE